ncbi:MAG: Cell division ATP-binding protein FtsE [candidate division Zixibacteria bacterium RBG-1]|nr:MAG: Cell division ATP-binding protein FtsE [candidate division Zixibacteria bacterium RBG-1]OGC83155.1 MAG: hypothetical protein A2V73_06955 [candidate division Zixibacteria bacterium RBG_19FT_COMBO_42_43]
MLEIKKVTKIYDEKTIALYNLSFSLNKGEFITVLGPTGAGKTTLIKLLALEESPTQGEIKFDSFTTQKMKKSHTSQWRQKLGIVFQDLRLIKDKSVFDNVALPLRIKGVKEKNVKKKTTEILGNLGLLLKRNSLPPELSGGERQKVAFARALVSEPVLFLADEPTANLDPVATEEILDLLTKIHNQGTTVMVTTNQEQVYQKFNQKISPARVLELELGKLK